MSQADPHERRLHDEFVAVEKEIESHSEQIDALKKRLEALKRAIELFDSDQLAVTELLRTSNGNGVAMRLSVASRSRVGATRRGRRPATRMPAGLKRRGASPRMDQGESKIKRVDMISTVLKRHPGLTVRQLIDSVSKEFGWNCTESNITGHLYTNPKRFMHTKADRVNKRPITWSLK
jgi:hypothetical protein